MIRYSRLSWLGWGMLLIGLPVALLGCGQECADFEQRCEGNTVLRCLGAESGNQWHREECGALRCVSTVSAPGGEVESFCAASTQPDARCSEPDWANCAGANLVSCDAGDALVEARCSSSCVTLDGLSDYCLEAPPKHPEHCLATGSEGPCELESSVLNTQTGTAPGAMCADQGLDAGSLGVDSARIYATRCEGGTLLERQRCATRCVFNPDCSTRCLD
jgi:hypothetical protein